MSCTGLACSAEQRGSTFCPLEQATNHALHGTAAQFPLTPMPMASKLHECQRCVNATWMCTTTLLRSAKGGPKGGRAAHKRRCCRAGSSMVYMCGNVILWLVQFSEETD
jgi:hypothetical protein